MNQAYIQVIEGSNTAQFSNGSRRSDKTKQNKTKHCLNTRILGIIIITAIKRTMLNGNTFRVESS